MAQQKSPFSASETTTYNIPGMNTIIIKTIRNVNRIEIRSHETTFPNLTETIRLNLSGARVYRFENPAPWVSYQNIPDQVC